MVPSAEQNQVVEVGFAASSPVVEVMRLAMPHFAARKAANSVAMGESAAQTGVNCPRLAPHTEDQVPDSFLQLLLDLRCTGIHVQLEQPTLKIGTRNPALLRLLAV